MEVLKKGQKIPTYKFIKSVTSNFVKEFLKLDEVYRPLRQWDNRKLVILLHYLHANLNLFTEYIENLTNGYVKRRRQDFDPRSSKLRRWVLEEIASDAHHYRDLSATVESLSSSIEALIGVLKTRPTDQEIGAEYSRPFAPLEAELKSCCKDLQQRLNRLSNDLETSLKYLDAMRNRDQTDAVQLLTTLATIFLPLSLSTGVLSMQSRFKDLGVLLYDFFGVVVLFAAVVMVILGVSLLVSLVKETATKLFHEWTFRRVLAKWSLLLGFVTFLVGLLVLASFIVGMFKDVHLGARILGYGLAILPGLPLFLTFLYFTCRIGYKSIMYFHIGVSTILGLSMVRAKRRQLKKKEKDLERNPLEGNPPKRSEQAYAEDAFEEFMMQSKRKPHRKPEDEAANTTEETSGETKDENEGGNDSRSIDPPPELKDSHVIGNKRVKEAGDQEHEETISYSNRGEKTKASQESK